MIISHEHKFIFIKTEKTAGTSLEIALSKICGPDDIITPISDKDEAYRNELGFRTKQNYFIPSKLYSKYDLYRRVLKGIKPQFYNHMSGRTIQQYVPKTTWNSYYKFCFERNPYDKLVSWYYWSGGPEKYTTILDFIKCGDAGKIQGFDLYTNFGIPIVDKVFKFEELSSALSELTRQFNLQEALEMPSKKTKGNFRKDTRSYREILTEEEKDWATKLFAREIQYFNYSF